MQLLPRSPDTLHSPCRQSILCDKVDLKKSYWEGISEEAKQFVAQLLEKDPAKRPTAKQALKSPWLQGHSGERSSGRHLGFSVVQRLQASIHYVPRRGKGGGGGGSKAFMGSTASTEQQLRNPSLCSFIADRASQSSSGNQDGKVSPQWVARTQLVGLQLPMGRFVVIADAVRSTKKACTVHCKT